MCIYLNLMILIKIIRGFISIEHDFGVMMLYDCVVKLGGADTSFLTWIAEEDFGKKVTVD
ncbi:hypothetical protein FP343_20210 [Escherichia coli]|nr:hypothetical protein [Escherichia coli]